MAEASTVIELTDEEEQATSTFDQLYKQEVSAWAVRGYVVEPCDGVLANNAREIVS